VLEAMSCEVPVVTSGSGFRKLLASTGPALSVAHGDVDAIVAAMGEHMAMSRPVRRELGAALRSVVRAGHDQDRLVNQVLDQMAALNRNRHRRLALLG
jgi:glycosyltransferase involved in cell wall biosynthesis